jgi:hypothetical protein
VHLVREIPPVVDRPPVRVDKREVERREGIGLPGHVGEDGTGDVDRASSGSLDVIELSDESFGVTTVSEVDLFLVRLHHRAEEVVVRWVTVREFIEQKVVELSDKVERQVGSASSLERKSSHSHASTSPPSSSFAS